MKVKGLDMVAIEKVLVTGALELEVVTLVEVTLQLKVGTLVMVTLKMKV